MGAWIETAIALQKYKEIQSHPSWVRGLKLKDLSEKDKELRSHPSWVRGLKQAQSAYFQANMLSHPSWVRGLKLIFDILFCNIDSRTPRGCVD